MLKSVALMFLPLGLLVSYFHSLAQGLQPSRSSVFYATTLGVVICISLCCTRLYRVYLPSNKSYHISYLFCAICCMHVLYLLFFSGCKLIITL